MEASVPEPLKCIDWLIGRWESAESQGQYPSIKDFKYKEFVEFKLCAHQPVVAYTGSSFHPQKNSPMHLESGFLRVRPAVDLETGKAQLSFMVAHNFGVVSLEEGEVGCDEVTLDNKDVARMTGAKAPAVVKIQRKFWKVPGTEDEIGQTLAMATSACDVLTPHLSATYKRVM